MNPDIALYLLTLLEQRSQQILEELSRLTGEEVPLNTRRLQDEALLCASAAVAVVSLIHNEQE